MKMGKKVFLLAAIILFLVIPLVVIGRIDSIEIEEDGWEMVKAEVTSSTMGINDYVTNVKYTIDGQVYNSEIRTAKQVNGKITIYYNEKDYYNVDIDNKRPLNIRELTIIYEIVGVFLLVDFIIIVFVYNSINKKDKVSIEELPKEKQEVNKNYLHHTSHASSKKVKTGGELVILGKITGVQKEDDGYSLNIEYEYKDEIYDFSIGGYDSDISDILKNKNIKYLKVFVNIDEPDVVRIDEKELNKKIKE